MIENSTIITVCSTKGGVGKTTLTAALGGLLASRGFRVLLVDADVQPALSSMFPLKRKAPAGLSNLMLGDSLGDIISTTNAGCDIIYSDDGEGKLPNLILQTTDGWRNLHYRLKAYRSSYDFILVDTQGAVGQLQDAAVFAADMLLSPIPTETVSAREFSRGMVGMMVRLRRPFCYSGMTPPHLHGVLYRTDHTRDAADVAAAMRGVVIDELRAATQQDDGCPNIGISIMDAAIPSAVAWREAATRRVPIHTLASRHPAALAALVAMADELGLLGAGGAAHGKG